MNASIGWQRWVLLVGVLSLVGFLLLLSLLGSGFLRGVDGWVVAQVPSWVSPVATFWMIGVTTLGQPLVLAGLATIAGFLLLVCRRWSAAVLLLVGLTVGSLLILPIKDVIHRSRPPDGLVSTSNLSFPSEHAAVALLFFGVVLVVVFLIYSSQRVRAVAVGLAVIAVLAISFSRIYLSVHWLSDVIGGWLFGLAWLMFSLLLAMLVGNRVEKKKEERRLAC